MASGNQTVIEILLQVKDGFSAALSNASKQLGSLSTSVGDSASAASGATGAQAAFGKSLEDVGKHAETTQAGLGTAASSASNLGSAATSATAGVSSLSASTSGLNMVTGAAAVTIGNLFTSAIEGTLSKLKEMVTGSVDAYMKLQQMEIMFKTVTGSMDGAKAEMGYVRKVATDLGLDLVMAGQSWGSFSAAAKSSSMPLEDTRKLFEGVSMAVTAMHLPAQNASSIFNQLQQSMSKGRIQMEELRIIAENLPGVIDKMSASMGITTNEMNDMMQKGTLLSNKALPALADALINEFAGPAKEAAHSLQSQFNLFKNAVFETSAAVGEQLAPFIAIALKAMLGLGNAIAFVVHWLKLIYEASGPVGPALLLIGAAFGTWAMIGPTLTAIATGFALFQAGATASTAAMVGGRAAMVAYQIATYAATAAQMALNSAIFSNPFTAVLGVLLLATIALATWIKHDEELAKNSEKNQQKMVEAQIEALKKKKSLDEDYEAAFGTSLDRQLLKAQQQYEKDKVMLEERYRADLVLAGNNEQAKADAAMKYTNDKHKLADKFNSDTQKLREDDRKKEQEHLDAKTDAYIKYLKLIGQAQNADDQGFAQKMAKERADLKAHFDQIESEAKANNAVLVGFEAEKQAAFSALQKQQFAEAARRGLDRAQEELALAKKSGDQVIAEIKRKVTSQVMTEKEGADQIAKIEEDLLRRSLDLAKQRAATFAPGTTEYKKAMGEVAAAETALTNHITGEAKRRIAERKSEYDTMAADAKIAHTKEMLAVQEAEASGIITTKEALAKKLRLEVEYAEQILVLKQKQLADAEATKDTDIKGYQAALQAKLDAEKAALAAKTALKDAEVKVVQEAATKEKAASDEVAKKLAADTAKEKEGLAALADFYSGVLNSAISKVKDTSDAAYNALMRLWESRDTDNRFSAQLREDTTSIEYYKQSLIDTQKTLGELDKMIYGVFEGLSEWANNMESDGLAIKAAFLEQKVALMGLADGFDQVTIASQSQIAAAEQALTTMDLLDKSDLDALKSKINSAKEALQELRDMARDTLATLQDELDELNNNKVSIEERAYQARMEELQEKLKTAQQSNDQQAIAALQEAYRVAEEIHKKKMANLDAERKAAEAAAKAEANTSSSSNSGKSVVNKATGGKLPGGESKHDSIHVFARPGEWFITNESAAEWGDTMMGAIHEPMSVAGKSLRKTLAAGIAYLRGAGSTISKSMGAAKTYLFGDEQAEAQRKSFEAQQIGNLERGAKWVKDHEEAHDKVAGPYSKGIHYDHVIGPDKKEYAVGGYVDIDTTPEKDKEAAKAKADQLKKAALAPAEPSPQDYIVAEMQEAIKVKADGGSKGDVEYIKAKATQEYDGKLDEYLKNPAQVSAIRKSNEDGWDVILQHDFDKESKKASVKAGAMSRVLSGFSGLLTSMSNGTLGAYMPQLEYMPAMFAGGLAGAAYEGVSRVASSASTGVMASSAPITSTYLPSSDGSAIAGLGDQLRALIDAARTGGGQVNIYARELTEDQVRKTVIPAIEKVTKLRK